MLVKIGAILVWICVCVDVTHQETEFEQQSLVSYTNCRVDSDCHQKSNHSFCFDNDQEKIGRCKCLEGYELFSRNKTSFACLGSAGYGEQCERNVQCQLSLTENAECSDGLCRCKENSHLFTDKKCYVSVVLGDFCRGDSNCWLNDGTFGNCNNGRCGCKFDRQVPASDRQSCVDGRRLAESCNNDAQCGVVPNSVCRVTCTCAANYALSRDEKKCLRVATELGDLCEENEQCSSFLKGTVCSRGRCECPAGQHFYSNRCTRTALLGQSCENHEECLPNEGFSGVIECFGGGCRCLPGVVNETVGCNGSFGVRASILTVFLTFSFYTIFQ
ncbi:unnamed protein product [Phaedon cochleariae]|uniref:EB domain-containing protein n=1 Tax=Phaedon cochleariae TaxID=80249 RepID=A0A9P0DRD7_PHACE|nr:unnamed protein product [Phaedon cochleariae]